VPTYVYRCQECGAVIERRQSFQDPPLTQCESCAGQLRKVLQPVGIIFKGSGFYTTDHRGSGYSDAAPKSEESKSEESKSSNGKTDSAKETSTTSTSKTDSSSSSSSSSSSTDSKPSTATAST